MVMVVVDLQRPTSQLPTESATQRPTQPSRASTASLPQNRKVGRDVLPAIPASRCTKKTSHGDSEKSSAVPTAS